MLYITRKHKHNKDFYSSLFYYLLIDDIYLLKKK